MRALPTMSVPPPKGWDRNLAQWLPVGIYQADRQGAGIWFNPRFLELAGLSEAEALGRGWTRAIHPEDRAKVAAQWSAADSGEFVETSYRLLCGDRVRWVAGRAVALREDDGTISGYLGTIDDITPQVEAEQALKRSLAEKEILLQEVHHRVKNNLQTVSSLLSIQARQILDPAAREAFEESCTRVRSIALLHETLYQSADLANISAGEYGRTLARLAQRSIGGHAKIRVIADEGVLLSLKAAVPCGLILNELLTNALKHAFPIPRDDARIDVAFRQTDQHIELAVSDNGTAGTVPTGAPRGMGLQLVRSLARQLGGEAACSHDSGTRWTVRFRAQEGSR